MIDDLAALIALQALDSAADAAHKRINEVPGAERVLDEAVAAAKAVVDQAKAKVDENGVTRRGLEKEVAGIDARMAKFEDHKAAVKTNQEFQALNHEIEVAQTSKSALEDQIIVLMDEADTLTATLKEAESVLKERQRTAAEQRAALHADKKIQEAELARLAGERATATQAIPAPLLTKYNQVAKNRRGVAVAEMTAGHCTACHVRLRPHVEQQVRRNDSILPCDSCQRILYYTEPPASDAPPSTGAPSAP
jgi:predicted  nucleic acid-binding Zn-ribbon protein